jgi:hypothetical protein
VKVVAVNSTRHFNSRFWILFHLELKAPFTLAQLECPINCASRCTFSFFDSCRHLHHSTVSNQLRYRLYIVHLSQPLNFYRFNRKPDSHWYNPASRLCQPLYIFPFMTRWCHSVRSVVRATVHFSISAGITLMSGPLVSIWVCSGRNHVIALPLRAETGS